VKGESENQNKLVSIIVAARNEEEYIGESLKSLINQTYENTEIVVVNDGSTDRTEEIVRDYMKKHKKIKLINIEHERDWGPVIPKRIGIDSSKGGYLLVVDADAYYDSDYIEKCLEKIDDKKVAGSLGALRVWEPRTWFSKCRDFHYRGRWNNLKNIEREIMAGLLPPWVFRKDVYYEVGEYNPELPYGEDRDFARKLIRNGYRIVYVPETEWHHKWEEKTLKVIKSQFKIGYSNYNYVKSNRIEVLKKLYFLSLIPFILLSFVNWIFVFLALMHVLPIGIKGLRLLKHSDKNRKYFLLFPLYIYVNDIPSSAGFIYGFLKRAFKS
jgi:hypothetical protein